jgi:hypothetical protein
VGRTRFSRRFGTSAAVAHAPTFDTPGVKERLTMLQSSELREHFLGQDPSSKQRGNDARGLALYYPAESS